MDTTFTETGFCNWKKAITKFTLHQNSQGHKEAVLKSVCTTPVIHQLTAANRRDQCVRREMFLKQLSTLRMLVRQGLAIRGKEEVNGNLVQILRLRAEDEKDISDWIANKKYISHDIVNESLEIMGNTLLRNLLCDIRKSGIHAIMADETRDVSNKEQLSVCIRWVDEKFQVNEDFLCLADVDSTSSSTILTVIKDILIRLSLPIAQCRGQCYDGAANMMGRLHGVAAEIRKEVPAAIPIHCFAHNLNLCLQNLSRTFNLVRDTLGLIGEINQLIGNSPKRSALFRKLKMETSATAPGIRPLCPTRWTVRTGAIKSVLDNYEALLNTMEELNECCDDDYGRRAGGILTKMSKFDTFFGLTMCYAVFSVTERFSELLQSHERNLQDATTQANVLKRKFESMKTDPAYNKFFDETEKASEKFTESPVLPRTRQIPKRFDQSVVTKFTSPKEYYRKIYVDVIDLTVTEIERRFNQESLLVPKETELLLITAANREENEDIKIRDEIREYYGGDVDIGKLDHQLSLLRDLVDEVRKLPEFIGLKKVTSIKSLAQIVQASPLGIALFSEVTKLIRIFLTLPTTTATAERSFSCLRRIKSYLRSTMTEKRLNNVMILHCHKDRTDNLDLKDIANKFINVNERRQLFFGSFS